MDTSLGWQINGDMVTPDVEVDIMWINNVRYAWEYPKPSIYVYVPITMSDSTEFNEDII